MSKTAYFTMDVESFYDAECLSKVNAEYDSRFSMEESLSEYLELLEKYDIKATLFTVVSSLKKIGHVLKKACLDGHEIALHGLDHKSPFDMTTDQFREQTKKGKKILEEEFGVAVKGFRAPCFGINDELLKILVDLGFSYDSSSLNFSMALKSGGIDLSSFEKKDSLVYRKNNFTEYSLPKENLFGKKIPVGGGAYLRLFPGILSRHLFLKYIKSNDSYIFYVHPFEISGVKAPRIKGLNLLEKMYLNLWRKNYIKKIEWIIKQLKREGYVFFLMGENLH